VLKFLIVNISSHLSGDPLKMEAPVYHSRFAFMVLFCAAVTSVSPLLSQTQMAGLRPGVVQTSPTIETSDALLLSQVIFNSDALPSQQKAPAPKVNPGTAAGGRVLNTVGTTGAPAAGGTWLLGGNAGTTCTASPCREYLGTNDANAFEIRVGGQRALRIEPQFDASNNSFAPNVISGFSGNAVSDGAVGATIAGGGQTGGGNNVTAKFGAVGGGLNNMVSGASGTVSGGENNNVMAAAATISGGSQNAASGQGATVAGGNGNSANGNGAFVAGGASNSAGGNYSFVAGHHASSRADAGAFVWGDDSSSSDVRPTAANQFVARSSGGVVFYTNPTLNSGVVLVPGGGSWASLSDRNLKEHFSSIDATEVLAQVMQLPIATWNYKSQSVDIRHIGPAAQDFFAAFNVGDDNRHITDIDEGGVALAAIQGLNQKLEAELKSKDAQLAEQQRVNERQEQEIGKLTQAVEQLRRQLESRK